MKILDILQYRVLKWAAADFSNSYHELLKFFQLLPLNMFLQLNDLLYLSKLLQNNNLTDCETEVCETNKSKISDKKTGLVHHEQKNRADLSCLEQHASLVCFSRTWTSSLQWACSAVS